MGGRPGWLLGAGEPGTGNNQAAFIYIVCLPLRETKLVARIRELASKKAGSRLAGTGIGDDCAVLRVERGHELLVTTDFSLEGIHFRRKWHPAAAVGHRCVARGLSDIAAMGGEPLAIFLSLAVPKGLSQRWVDDFMRGLLELAGRFAARLAGGDTAQSPGPIAADIVVVGSVPGGEAILRSGAKAGDGIYVSGELGGSAGTVERLYAGRKLKAADFGSHFRPEPRIGLGRLLREKRLASAMIDVSDGLSTDLTHICEESGLGAELWEETIPRARVGKKEVELRLALHGGEDYELLFTAPPRKRIPSRAAGVRITKIGVMTRGKAIRLKGKDGSRVLEAGGWEHFGAKKSR